MKKEKGTKYLLSCTLCGTCAKDQFEREAKWKDTPTPKLNVKSGQREFGGMRKGCRGKQKKRM